MWCKVCMKAIQATARTISLILKASPMEGCLNGSLKGSSRVKEGEEKGECDRQRGECIKFMRLNTTWGIIEAGRILVRAKGWV